MNIRLWVFLELCFLLLLTTQAFALEHSEKRWNGFYAGADIGGIQSNIKMQTVVAPGGTYFDYRADAPQIAAAGNGRISPRNFSAGVFGGYNRQFKNILVGIETSVNRVPINESLSASEAYNSFPDAQFVLNQSIRANWEGTLRLRLGLAQNRWLAYLTGGAAMTNIKYTSSFSDNNIQPGSGLPGAWGTGTVSKIKCGWILGGGAEYALSNAWAIKGEYLYTNFGEVRASYIITPTPTLSEFSSSMNSKATLTVQSLLAGLTYRF